MKKTALVIMAAEESEAVSAKGSNSLQRVARVGKLLWTTPFMMLWKLALIKWFLLSAGILKQNSVALSETELRRLQK